jgi:transcriptional regulator with XRE-family HTH domain
VPGLRREELAALAGISSEYYLRLEQGRDRHPSPQVIDSLARALRLDAAGIAHLYELAQPRPVVRRNDQPEAVRASVVELLALWRSTPAFVTGRCMDILVSNALAVALSPLLAPGVNLPRAVFLDPEMRRLVDDWDDIANRAVAGLRARLQPNVEDARLAGLIDELSAASEHFRLLWERHDVELAAHPIRTFHHPVVGTLELKTETFIVTGEDRHVLVVYHAAPGSPSESGLVQLESLIPKTGPATT